MAVLMQFADGLTGKEPNRELTRILIISFAAIPLSVATGALPHDEGPKWGLVGLAVLLAGLITVKTAADGMFTGNFRRVIPAWHLAIQMTILTAAAGLAVYAGSGPLGIYRPLLVVNLVFWALFSDRSMLVFGLMLSVLALGFASAAQGIEGQYVLTLMVEHALCWGAMGTVIHMLASATTDERERARRLTETADLLAELASTAARSRDIEAALPSCVPLIARILTSDIVVVASLPAGEGTPQVLAAWPGPEVARAHFDLDEMRLDAVASSGSTIVAGDRSIIPIGSYDGDALVVIVVGSPTIAVSKKEGTLASIATILTNTIERVSFVQALDMLTRTDPLTGLANRLELAERLDHEIEVAKRTGAPVSVVMIDLDLFKTYNDTFGHIAGDQVLRLVAETLVSRARGTDIVARYGGEEFCVCVPGADAVTARALVDDQRRVVEGLDAQRVITFSAGIAEWDRHESIDYLLARADASLYDAKARGRNRVEVASAPENERRPRDAGVPRPSIPPSN